MRRRLHPSLKITLIYLIFGILWVVFSDRLAENLITEAHLLTQFQTFKGLIFVLLTSGLVFGLSHREHQRMLAHETEKQRLFQATMRAVQHVLFNFMNQMLLFKEAASDSRDFDRTILVLYDEVIEEAEDQLKALSNIEELSEERIRESIFG